MMKRNLQYFQIQRKSLYIRIKFSKIKNININNNILKILYKIEHIV